MDIVGHNTEKMRTWSNDMNNNSNEYGTLIRNLYNLVEEFANSNEFKGGLSDEFLQSFLAMKQEYLSYENIFNECTELINAKAHSIDADDSYLQNRVRSGNPLN